MDSAETGAGEGAGNAIDGDPLTIWHTEWSKVNTPQPHEIRIDLGEVLELAGFSYLPRQDGNPNGTILRYEFYAGLDGEAWDQPLCGGAFANVRNNPILQKVTLDQPVSARFIRLVSLEEVNGRPWASAAEIGVLTKR